MTTSLREGASSASSGGSLASASSLSEADPSGLPPASLNLVRLEPGSQPQARAAATRIVDRTSCLGTCLPARGAVQPHNIPDRFWEKVDATGDCWLWLAGLVAGYGRFWFNGKDQLAHRVAYELVIGPIPEGLQLDHLCRNPPCVNPEHLEPVTARTNTLRGEGLAAQEAAQTHCKHGHEFTDENTRRWNGERRCRQCHRIWASYRKQRRRHERDGIPFDREAVLASLQETKLEKGDRGSMLALREARQAWGRVQQQLELEVWPA